MTTKSDDDARLVERFQAGERRAFDEIDRRYRSRLVRFLNFRTESSDVAEELAQETLIRAFGTLDGLKRGVFLAGWLYRVAFRLLVDSTRRRRLNVVSFDENPDDSGESSGVVFASRISSRRPNGAEFAAPEPDERAVRAEERSNLWRVAQQILSPDEFQTLWFRYVDEATDREIANALGKSPGAVRVALTRARKKLAVYLRDESESCDQNQE